LLLRCQLPSLASPVKTSKPARIALSTSQNASATGGLPPTQMSSLMQNGSFEDWLLTRSSAAIAVSSTPPSPHLLPDLVSLTSLTSHDFLHVRYSVITAILSLTTEPGLTSLLPRPNAAFPLSTIGSFAANASLPSIYTSPHLPLTPTHESASFSLLSLFPPIVHPSFLSNSSSPLPFISPYISTSFKPSHSNTTPMLQLLPFTLSLLSRYRHTLGSTPSYFTSLRGPYSFKKLRKDLAKAPEMAFLCVNDDLPTWADREAMKRSVREWGEEMWPMKGEWEL
jgi:hypothetical protein